MPAWMDDLRFGLRAMSKSPGFTALAVVTLALGIGATTSIFTVVDAVLLKPLPYPDPDRIVTLWEREPGGAESNTSFATFRDVERENRSLAAIAVMGQWQPTFTSEGEPERFEGQRVSQKFFSVLGVHPAIGRDFLPEEDVTGRHRVVMLGHGLWQRRFGGDPAIVGRAISLNEIPHTVVGVMPEGFESPTAPNAEAWAPLGYNETQPWACRTCRHLQAVARLRAGVGLDQAAEELNVLSADLVRAHPNDYPESGIVVLPLQRLLTRTARPALLALLGAVLFVLLIACANVASLLLGRTLHRENEFAVRAALGAGRLRIARQLLTESVLLGLTGGAAGIALAWWGLRVLLSLAPGSLPRIEEVRLDPSMLGFALVFSLLSGVLAGLAPALVTSRLDLHSRLKQGPRTVSPRSHGLRGVMVVAEIALALMLLIGAGLLLRSLDRLLSVQPGFDPANLLTMEVQTGGARYENDDPTIAFFTLARERVEKLPGVVSAAWASQVPLGGDFDTYGVHIEEKPRANPAEDPSADRYAVSPGYLGTMRIPLLRGRGFTGGDAAGAPAVILINETFSRRSWPEEDPVGKRVRLGDPNGPWRTIVGIVGDVKHMGLDAPPTNQIYLPQAQWVDSRMVLVVRAGARPADLTASVRGAVWSVDKDRPIAHVATMDSLLGVSTARRRFTLQLFEVFAAVALALAAAGIYGALAANVGERTREIGIRCALGASRSDILSLVMRHWFRLTLAGMALGAAGTLAVSRLISGMLFGVAPQDPVTFAGVVTLLGMVGLGAALVPAWRATRVDPVVALRTE